MKKKRAINISLLSSLNEAVFENGIEKRRMKKINGDVMIEYDEEGREVYKGEYNEEWERIGKGELFEYDGNQLKEIYDCEDGKRTIKRMMFGNYSMTELNANGVIVYKGGFEGSPEDGFVRSDEGEEFDENGALIYSGYWKNDKKEGNGMLYSGGHLKYDGDWKNDKPNGDGKIYNDDGVILMNGEWKNGFLKLDNGLWKWYEDGSLCDLYENGELKYKGEWKDGKPDGEGTFYRNGKELYKGKWRNGYYQLDWLNWFSYMNDDIRIAIPLWKDHIPSFLSNCFSFEEVMNEDAARLLIWSFYCFLTPIVLFLIHFLLLKLPIIIDDIIIKSSQCDVIRNMNSSITELIIPENGCKDAMRLDLSGFDYLRSITIKRNAFYNTPTVVIESMVFFDWLILRSSSTERIECWS